VAIASPRKVRYLLLGVGNVGRRFLELTVNKADVLRQRFNLVLVPVGVADSSGLALNPTGLDPGRIVALKAAGKGVANYPDWGQQGDGALDMVCSAIALSPGDRPVLLIDASPVNLENGQPGLGCIEAALQAGLHVVTANKAPLVLAFPRLLTLARERGVSLGFDATVAGGLPAVNLGQRDLAAADIYRLEGVLNLTTNYILTRMADEGLTYDQALAEAQAAGHAETDPRLDVEGWDAANKLVILAHSVLGQPVTLAGVEVEGIGGVTTEMLSQAATEGRHIKLLAVAERAPGGWRFRVGPQALDAGHPLARLGPKQMGIVYYTDISGVLSAAIVEETPLPTASAVLRDVVQIFAMGPTVEEGNDKQTRS
jgi:homoserine dehydrogenase